MTAENPTKLTHIDASGAARMVDVGDKPVTHRVAVAGGFVEMAPATLEMIASNSAPKGDVLAVARVAGIMAAKRTSDLIPMCHPLGITHAAIVFLAEKSFEGKRGMVVTDVRLLLKKGGKSGTWTREDDAR